MARRLSSLLILVLWSLSFAGGGEEESKAKAQEGQDVNVEVVVSASRKAEKKLEAAATVVTATAATIAQSAYTAPMDVAATLPGVHHIKGGLTYQRLSARGFATSFIERMLSLVDGKLATLPGGGIPQGFLMATSELDVKRVEVLLGPASALYGSNAVAGVYNVLTKSAWDESGTAISVKAGDQNLVETQLRHAGLAAEGRFGWKVNAGWMQGEDVENDNVFFSDTSNQSTHTAAQTEAALSRTGPRSGWAWRESELAGNDVSYSKVSTRLSYRAGDWELGGEGGWSSNDGLSITNTGRNRLDGFEVTTLAVDLRHPNIYFHANRTENDAGDSYGIQNVTPFLAAGLPLEDVISRVDRAKLYDSSSLNDFELQLNGQLGPVELIGGATYRAYEPDSFGTYLDDFRDSAGNALAPIRRYENGVYLQGELAMLDERLRLTAAVRRDAGNEYDAQISPKLALVYNWGDHHLRLSYNEAHRDPSILENHLYFGGVARGNGRGWRVQSLRTGEIVATYDALEPETVETIEAGYRSVLTSSLSLDLTVYKSDYSEFISGLQLIAAGNHPTNPTVAIDADGNIHPVVLTYLNYGEAEVEGLDLALDWTPGSKLRLGVSYSYQNLASFTNDTPIPDLGFNSPEQQFKLSATWSDPWRQNSFLTLSGNYHDSYQYISGRWVGTDASPLGPIPSNQRLDLAAGQNLPAYRLGFKLVVQNLTDSDKVGLIGLPVAKRLISLELNKRF